MSRHRLSLTRFIFSLFILSLCMVTARAQQPVSFIRHSQDFQIVIPAQHADLKPVAIELQQLLQRTLQCEFVVCTDREYQGGKAISIGRNRLSEKLYTEFVSQIVPDGFLLHTDADVLFILGNEDDTMAHYYGVYHLMENYFGCTYTCANSLHCSPLPDTLTLSLHNLQNPAFRYRETLHLLPNLDARYARWHKLHNRTDFNREWGSFVHTFRYLIPVEKYFDTHPEWFSEMHGQRVRDGQLCLSNPEVLEELCRNLEQQMRADPGKKVWSVSQNDNESSCTCEHCRHLDSLYGGPSGTMIWFVNQVAERFPDKTISTLAYQQTRHAPANIRPDKNVNIMFCSIECQRTYPIASETGVNSFQYDMEQWTALTDNIFLWDYVVQFRNFFDPFPNFHVIQPNLQNFRDHHIPMIFEQGSNQNITESHEWRTFLIAHLLWNPDINTDSLRKCFFDAHYGPQRTPYILQYYDIMQDKLLLSGQRLNIYGYPINAVEGYLHLDNILEYERLFQHAFEIEPFEGCTPAQRRTYNDRLRLLQLSLDFAVLDLTSHGCFTPEKSFFNIDKKGRKVVRKDMIDRLENFVDDCDRLGVKFLDEATFTPQQFRYNILHYVEKNVEPNLSMGQPVTCSTEWSNLYDVGGPTALTDGKMGMMDYNYDWLGFWGNNMDVVIDLGKRQSISQVSADFLYYPLSWIFAPKHWICYVSDDNEHWTMVGESLYENGTNLIECKIVPFHLSFPAVKGRFVRVVAESLLTNPEWHRGVGQPCWIFCDEVIVR